jgi:2-isopropylmalate synthase
MKRSDRIEILDTTLRDGAQTSGVTFSVDDKLRIARVLDDLGIPYIEGGWPGSNPKDEEFFARVRSLRFRHARIVAFGATRRKGIRAPDDPSLRAIVRSGAKTACIFGKSWLLHVYKTLRTTPDENLAMISESVAFLRARGIEVIYDAEHFFDGYAADPAYAVRTIAAALQAGATCAVLCDTNGGTLPEEVGRTVRALRGDLAQINGGEPRLGIHAHNDAECAVANSLTAVAAGCVHVQGTMNGLGERCGNANLCSVIPALELKMGRRVLPAGSLYRLTEASRAVDEIANLIPDERRPYVGANAFAHKAGVHASAVARDSRSYEHVRPESVGNARRILVSELAGRANLMLTRTGMRLQLDEEHLGAVVKAIKQKEFEGYSYENAEGSFALLVHAMTRPGTPLFETRGFRVIMERDAAGRLTTEATVRLTVGGREEHVVADGDGPVNALDAALRKALERYYPKLRSMKLTDFKVRVVNPAAGTAAKVRVNIQSRDGASSWTTVGVSENIIEASWEALTDAIAYRLLTGSRGAGATVRRRG